MEISQLRYLVAIEREGSLTRAAVALRVSQPTLSVAMKGLEDELGVQLLHRGRGGARLTPAGLELLDAARDVLTRVSQAEQRVRGVHAGERGRFVLGCNPSLGAYFLPDFLRGFIAAFPGIDLVLWNGSSADVRQAIVDGDVHFGLIVNTIPHPELVIREAFGDRVEIVESSALPPAATADEAFERVRSVPLIYADLPAFRGMAGSLAAAELLSRRPIVCGTLELVKALALGRVGVALLPLRVALHDRPEALRPVHAEVPGFDDRIHLVHRADMPRTRAASLVKQALLAHGAAI